MENAQPQNTKRSIQDYLSLGYLYLLLLGIVSDVIYYKHLDINILSYSHVLDILLSPLAYLTKGLAFPLTLLAVGGLFAGILTWRKNQLEKQREKLIAEGKDPDSEKHKTISKKQFIAFLLTMGAIFVFSGYIGLVIGYGGKQQERLQNGEFKADHTLTFIGTAKEVLDVKIIGQNSQYVFYVKPGAKTVTVSPIPGNIKSIDKLPESN